MKVQELRGGLNGYMTFVLKDPSDIYSGKFATLDNFSELLWYEPPELILKNSEHNQMKYQGKVKKIPDIGHYTPGSLIVNEKTKQFIGDYLQRFGKLIPITVEGELWYSYVVTNVLEGVVDVDKSVVSKSGTLKKPAFFIEKLPAESQIFKIPENGLLKIYFNKSDHDSIVGLLDKYSLDAGEIPVIWDSEQAAN